MARFTIQETATGKFQLLDEGFTYDVFDTRAEAEAQQQRLELEDKLGDEISTQLDAVEEAYENAVSVVTVKYPTFTRRQIAEMVREALVDRLS